MSEREGGRGRVGGREVGRDGRKEGLVGGREGGRDRGWEGPREGGVGNVFFYL